jgi:hypothetical protein
MRSSYTRVLLRNAATVAIFVFTAALWAPAQSSGPRNLEELKAETQRRVDRNLTPATGLKSEDAREALANIHSLDRDEWAAAWSAIADRYARSAAAEESSDKAKAQQDYLMAWRYIRLPGGLRRILPARKRPIRKHSRHSETTGVSLIRPWKQCTFRSKARRLSAICVCQTAFVPHLWS